LNSQTGVRNILNACSGSNALSVVIGTILRVASHNFLKFGIGEVIVLGL
jgi:hypothetical protein